MGREPGSAASSSTNLSVANFDLGQSQSLALGLGPLLEFPIATSTNFGPDVTQGGASGVIQAELSWGIIGLLGTYQHTLSGGGSQLTTVQPVLYYNFQQGWYFRSDAVMRTGALERSRMSLDSASRSLQSPITNASTAFMSEIADFADPFAKFGRFDSGR